MLLIDSQQTAGLQLRVLNLVLVAFVEHKVQNLLCFDVSGHISVPNFPRSMFVGLVRLLERRHNH